MIIRVIDFETTGMEPPAEIIEVGWQDVVVCEDGVVLAGGSASLLFGAPGGVPPMTMAVHHLTPAMLDGRPPCSAATLREVLEGADVVAAHNAAFEGKWLTPDALGAMPVACTLKAALRVWPDAPAHSNQVLRYWLGLDLCDERAMPPHRAQPDAYVTAHILVELLKHASVADLIQWTTEPRVMPKLMFGKHRGAKWSEVPADYLDWLVFKSDLDSDTKWNACREIERRRATA